MLNGEPFTRYCLRSLYPFAHEIIVVEGASKKAAVISTPDGHSTDGTLESLSQFKTEEDPENKVQIITKNSFWDGKDEQSQAYAIRATGDYLWQVDIDEFYKPEDMIAILTMLHSDPNINQVNIQWLNFWGDFNYLVDGLFLQQHYKNLDGGVPRIFKWEPGYKYITHRPPTVFDINNNDLSLENRIKGNQLAKKGIYCYHYSTIIPDLVNQKMQYYSQQNWEDHDKFYEWYQSNFIQIHYPFRVHHATSYVSWLSRFNRIHPPQIQQLIIDLKKRNTTIRIRGSNDIELLLSKKRYILGVLCFRFLASVLLRLRNHFPNIEKSIEHLIEKVFTPKKFSKNI